MDKRQLIAALVEKTGIKLGEDDPAFLLVDLNLLVLEKHTSEAAKQLTAATAEFNAVTTRSVDDFVAVANEALSKFMQRTNELKAALDGMAPAPVQAPAVMAPAPAPAPAVSGPEKKPPSSTLWWLLPLVFSVGLVAGVGLSFMLTK